MNNSGMPYRFERGAALFVTLILLVVITLFALSMINSNIVSTRVVAAQQSEKTMELAAEQALEKFISTSANFLPAPTTTTQVNVTTPAYGTASGNSSSNQKAVTVSAPKCIGETVATGFSLCQGFNCPPVPKDTTWEISATASDSATGASVSVTEGVKIQLPSGNC